MNHSIHPSLLLAVAGSFALSSLRADPPPVIQELTERLHTQVADFPNMETLRASYQSAEKEEGIRHAHVYLVRLNGPIQVVTESDSMNGEFLQRDYFLHQSKVYGHRVSHHVPTLDGKTKRVSESYFLFDNGKPVYRGAVTARVPLSAKEPDLSKVKERVMPLPAGADGWGDKLTARAFDIARTFRPSVGHYAFGDWDQWLLKDAPPAGSGIPPARHKDWLPPEGTLALPVQESESPDGLFSIGWGYDKGPIDWSDLAHEEAHGQWGGVTFSTKLADGLSEELQKDENFLMNHVTGKVAGKINAYYPGERQRFNHDELIAFWSPSSACAVVLVTAKWESEFAHVVWIKDGACEGSQDIMEPLTKAAISAVLKSRHPAAKRLRGEDEGFMYSLDRIIVEDNGAFEAQVSGVIPKDDDLSSSYFEIIIEGVLSPGPKDESALLKVTKSRVLPPEKQE